VLEQERGDHRLLGALAAAVLADEDALGARRGVVEQARLAR
jgi:hypothetical protein